MKIKDNLSKELGKALKDVQPVNNNTKVYPFDRGSGFAVSSKGDAIKKDKNNWGKLKLQQKYTNKVQKH